MLELSSIKYFGSPEPFSDFDEKKCKETYDMYETVTRDSKVYNVKKISYKDFKKQLGIYNQLKDLVKLLKIWL